MRRYSVVRGTDLRMSQHQRLEYVEGRGVAFLVNNAHTIAHVVIGDDPDTYIRSKIPGWLKGTIDGYFHKWLKDRFDWILGISEFEIKTVKPAENHFGTTRKYRNYQKKNTDAAS